MAARRQPAPSETRSFDAEAFYEALDGARQVRKLTWKQVADQAKVSASTLTRMGQGRRPDVDSLASLTSWAGISADDFVKGKRKRKPETLAMISTYLRGDPNLSPEAARMLETIVKTTYEQLRKD